MINNKNKWIKTGKFLSPVKNHPWLSTFTGPSYALPIPRENYFDLYVTGRDTLNRSMIGKVRIEINNEKIIVHSIENDPIFTFGERGCFDENGVSYPFIIPYENKLYMYYVGWMPTTLTPFQNRTGLAISDDGGKNFIRASRAPILPLTNAEPFCTGSLAVLKENDIWKMWYTVWKKWGNDENDHKHYYLIKYATSNDGINWDRDEIDRIKFGNKNEYAIGKPSVIKYKGLYHMWYVYRGEQYKIGYAYSLDGKDWERRDDLVGINTSINGWDSEAICYPHIVELKNRFIMFYCGNNYGREGLGSATLLK